MVSTGFIVYRPLSTVYCTGASIFAIMAAAAAAFFIPEPRQYTEEEIHSIMGEFFRSPSEPLWAGADHESRLEQAWFGEV